MGKQLSEMRPGPKRVCRSVIRIHEFVSSLPVALQASPESWEKYQYGECDKKIWVAMTNRLWTNRVKLSSSNDINSLVPCLAVKGTNLMISQGLGRADESARWFKCWCFTGAVGHREACCGWPVQAVWQKATGLQSPAWGRCFTSVIQWGANVWEISQLRLKIQLELMHLNAGQWGWSQCVNLLPIGCRFEESRDFKMDWGDSG